MKSFDFRTDLADERAKFFKNEKLDGILINEKRINEKIKVSTVKIVNEKGSKKLQKKIGTYTTIDIGDVNIIDSEELDKEMSIFAEELRKIVNNLPENVKERKNIIIYKNENEKSNSEKNIVSNAKDKEKANEKGSILVVGLGNKNITADSIGSKVVENLNITRHILKYSPELLPENTRELCAIAPGVLGTTGIETQEIIEGVVEKTKVKAIIAIDAIETNDISRLLRTIQITDTGIAPGSGVNNKRKEISFETMHIPVIAIGVPTVVEAATIVANTLDILSNKFGEFKFLRNSSFKDKYELIRAVLEPSNYNLAVMPKEIDSLVDNIKEIISYGINCLVWLKIIKFNKLFFKVIIMKSFW